MSDLTAQRPKKDNTGIRANRLDLQVQKNLHYNVTKQQTKVQGDVTYNVNDKSRCTIQQKAVQNFGNRSAVYQDECNITTYGDVTRRGSSETTNIQGTYESIKKGNAKCFSVVNFSAVVGSSTNFSTVMCQLGQLNTNFNLLSNLETSEFMFRVFSFSYLKLVKSTCRSIYYKSHVTNDYISTGTVDTLNILIGKRNLDLQQNYEKHQFRQKLRKMNVKLLQY